MQFLEKLWKCEKTEILNLSQQKEGIIQYQNQIIILHCFSQIHRASISNRNEKKKDTESFIVYIKTDDIYKDIAEDIETRFDTLNYELERLFPKGKNKKVIWLMKDELGRKIMAKFVGLTAKTQLLNR